MATDARVFACLQLWVLEKRRLNCELCGARYADAHLPALQELLAAADSRWAHLPFGCQQPVKEIDVEAHGCMHARLRAHFGPGLRLDMPVCMQAQARMHICITMGMR